MLNSIPQSVISATLDSHALWLKGDPKGERAYLTGANLEGAYLNGANLDGANLEGAYLNGAYLNGANLKGANLEGANLERASLERANLERASLERANLNGAYLNGANLKGANVENTILTAFKHDGYQVIFQRNRFDTILYYGCEVHPISEWLRRVDLITMEHIQEPKLIDKKVEEILNLIEQHKVENSYENTTASKILF